MMNPLPSLTQAFSQLIQDKRQREIISGNHLGTDFTSLNTTAFTSKGHNGMVVMLTIVILHLEVTMKMKIMGEIILGSTTHRMVDLYIVTDIKLCVSSIRN